MWQQNKGWMWAPQTNGLRTSLCHFGCPILEDPHHLFVHCPVFQHLCDEYFWSLVADISHTLSGVESLETLRPRLTHIVTHLFWDDDCWPLGSSLYYMGLVPPLLPPTHPLSLLSTDSHWLLTWVAHSCHSSAIQLAAHIWGMVLRQYGLSATSPSSGQAVGLRSSRLALVLPSHLQHLLHS